MAILTVLALWKAGRKARSIRQDSFAMIPLLICVIYFMFGIPEIVWNPGQLILALVFLVMHPQLAGETERVSG